MRSKNPALMEQIKAFAEQYFLDNGTTPSTAQIGEEVGLSRGRVYQYLVDMDHNGMITYQNGEISTSLIQKHQTELSHAAIVGSVPCGSPQYEEENIEAYVSLPTAIFGKGDFYILRASGDSMIDAGINSGDYVVVKKQNAANEGDIVVALVENQNTLKRFYLDRERHCVRLHPENPTMDDIYVQECYIQGVAKSVIKSLE